MIVSDDMSALDLSLPMHSASVSNNGRDASDSDHSRHKSELTLSAIRVILRRNKQSHHARSPRRLFDHLIGERLQPICHCKVESLGSFEVDHERNLVA